ncbi:MAG TPA: hypothetical protein VF656_03475 [Pyrinomonadaceae bacterium]|jgi:hypothetical protein
MPPRRIHVVQAAPSARDFFPYSHYRDQGHNPLLNSTTEGDNLVLVSEDIFKLKPNVQMNPKTRIDIYMPGEAAMGLGVDIVEQFGPGEVAELSQVNPDDFRRGPQRLPLIRGTRSVRHSGTELRIAGCVIGGNSGPIYVEHEAPDRVHVEMEGPEIHIGISLQYVRGEINQDLVEMVNVPVGELRVGNERNPIRKANGVLRVILAPPQARNLAATLIHFGQGGE